MRKVALKLICLLFLTKGFATSLVTEDFKKAQLLSEDYQMPMALLFTGSDWSEESQTALDEWNEQAETLGRDIILTWIDFPEFNTMPTERVQMDYSLQQRFQVRLFPTLVLLSSEGEEVARLGFPLEESLGALLKQKLSMHRDVVEDWERVIETKDETLLLSCYKRLQRLSCVSLMRQVISYAVEHQLCPELLFKHYVTLVNEGKHEEAKAFRPNLKKDVHLALFDFQQDKNVLALEEFLKTCQNEDEKTIIKQISMTSHSEAP